MRRGVGAVLVLALTMAVAGAAVAGGQKEARAAGPVAGYTQPQITTRMVDTTRYKKPAPWTIGFSNDSLAGSWRLSLVAHLRYAMQEGRRKGLVRDFYETDAKEDTVKQIADIEELAARGVDLLIVSAAAPEALTPVVEKMIDRGIPVITVDRNVSSDRYVSFVECSGAEMGRLQAQWLAARLQGQGNVVLLPGLAGAKAAEDRLRAAREVFALLPRINILDVQYTGWSNVQGKQIMQTIIQRFPRIDGVWADSGRQGSGAVEAFREAGLKVPPITGEDYNRFLKIWRQDRLDAVAVTFSVRQGYAAGQLAFEVLRGEEVPHHVVVPNLVITEANLAEYVRMDLPDDYWAESMPEVARALFPNR